MDIADYIYINNITRNLLNSNSSDLCNNFFEKYNCSICTFESLLKIDKINGIKYALTTKTKKKILFECENIQNNIKPIEKNKKNKKNRKNRKI